MKTDQVTGLTKLQVHFEAELPAEQSRKAYPLFLTVRRVGDDDSYGGDFVVDLEKPGLRLDEWGLFSLAELRWIGEQLVKFEPRKDVTI